MTAEKKPSNKNLEELKKLRRRLAALEQAETERRLMETALRESESQKRAILDASLDRIRHVDKDLRILWANKTSMEQNMALEDIVGKTCHQVFVGKEAPCEGCPNVESKKTGRLERAIIYKPHVCGIEGETAWDLYIVPLKNDAGDISSFFQIARNITNQKRAEDSLRKSEEMFRGIFTGSPIGIVIYNSDGDQINTNTAYREIFGIAGHSAAKGCNLFREPFVPDSVKDNLLHFQSVRYEFSFDFDIVGKRDTYKTEKTGVVYLDVQITPLVHTDHIDFRGYLVQVQDITRRKLAEEQIRNLTHDLIKAQESERQKISRDLHDRVAQDLSTLKIGFDTLFDSQPGAPGELKRRISTLTKILQGSIEAVRDLAYELRPPGLDQLGLVKTLFQYSEDFSEKAGFRVDFFSAGLDDMRLDFNTEINLYRLIQEALNNVKKHAGADRVTIRLVASFPKIILRIEDNGQGFNIDDRYAAAINEKRMGLQNMKERVSLLNGKMAINSRPMGGTKIVIEIPSKETGYETKEKHPDYR
jgi:PAS domain S-box-containing protein